MIPPAGAMFSTSTYQSQDTSRPSSRKANGDAEGPESVKKPKKVNSEIRKQQNRIASRNYREKRKRKLQYLQQLLKDGDSPEEAAQTVEEAHRDRMVTPEYHARTTSGALFTLPSNTNFHPLAATSGNAIESTFATSATSYGRQFNRPSQHYAPLGTTWDTAVYGSPSSVDVSAWNVPNWMPNVDYTPSVSSRSEDFQYTPPQRVHHTFEQLPTPPQHHCTPEPDLYGMGAYGHSRRADSHHPMGIPNANLPSSASSSPFQYTRYNIPYSHD